MTSTAPSDNYSGRGSTTTTITDNKYHLKLWPRRDRQRNRGMTVIALPRLPSSRIWGYASWTYRYDEHGTALPSSTNLDTSPPFDAQSRWQNTRRWPSQEWRSHRKVHGHHHQHVILKKGTEAYDRTRNAPHRTERYPWPYRRHRVTSARVGQQSADALPH